MKTKNVKNQRSSLKRIFVLFTCFVAGLVLTGRAGSTIPKAVNYQGVLYSALNNAVVTNAGNVVIRLYDQAEGGTLLWGETRMVYPKKTLPQQGLISVVLGEGTPLPDTEYASLDEVFALGDTQDKRYIEFQLESSTTPIAPRQQFLPSSYAFIAADGSDAKEDFSVTGVLTVSSETLGTAQLTVGGNLDVAEYVTMTDDATFDGTTKITKDATFNESVSFNADVTMEKGGTVKGNMTATVSQTKFAGGLSWDTMDMVYSNNTSVTVGESHTASTDGFLIIDFKTNRKDNDNNGHVNVTVAGNTLQMRHFQNYGGAGNDMKYYDVAMVPVAMGESFSITIDGEMSAKSGDYTLTAQFIPLGK
ncbi:MAG: hypothetical protein EOL87_04340 [Spartobacteria bacterium]|nr:hypothetical protein [Spartobacteria bacterium]